MQRAPLSRGARVAIAGVVGAVLAWRVIAVGVDAMAQRERAAGGQVTMASLDAPGAGDAWRRRLARNPADAQALVVVALDAEKRGRRAEADAAMREALRLAPGDPATLRQTAAFFLRTGDDAMALATLRRMADAAQGDGADAAWPVFVSAVNSGAHRPFFDDIATTNPPWWPQLFGRLCESANVVALQALFATREKAKLAGPDERRCVVERLQRDGHWTSAYLVWLNALPADRRQDVPYVFNGDFEYPLTNLGFDWLTPAQEGVTVANDRMDGPKGERVLAVAFENKRFAGPPIAQYLLLAPGRYRLAGRGRSDLETWLGLQWGLYCVERPGQATRQLTHSDRFIGSADWSAFRQDFTVPKDCPVQLLRLELANPRRDATTPGAVVVRLKGRVWFDDMSVRILDERLGG